MKTSLIAPLAMLCICGQTYAAPRTSADFELTVESTGAGGGRSTSPSYALDSSIGGIGGISSAAGPDIVAKTGYTGQLYDVDGVVVTASPATVDEGASRQLSATAVLDDATLLDLDGEEVNWSVVSGPLTGIDSSGLATAGMVYEHTPATAQGAYFDGFGQLGLTVLNLNVDDYAEYGGDGIDDDWQVLHFGEPPIAEAAPDEDPDGDSRDNAFEFLTGFDPNDAADFFQFKLLSVSGTTATLELNKAIPDRTYTLKAGTDLIGFNETVTSFSVLSETADYTEQDTHAADPAKFYIIEVTKP